MVLVRALSPAWLSGVPWLLLLLWRWTGLSLLPSCVGFHGHPSSCDNGQGSPPAWLARVVAWGRLLSGGMPANIRRLEWEFQDVAHQLQHQQGRMFLQNWHPTVSFSPESLQQFPASPADAPGLAGGSPLPVFWVFFQLVVYYLVLGQRRPCTSPFNTKCSIP